MLLENRRIRVACMSDGPLLHTGFATVAAELYKGFHEAGMEVHVLGFMDSEHDYLHQLPYFYNPVNAMDELAHNTFGFFLRKVKPDVIFILTDPGNLVTYAAGIVHNMAATYLRNGREFVPPIVAYTPVEGLPLASAHKAGFEFVKQTAGKLVFYNQTSQNNVAAMWPEIAEGSHWVWHGLDHANFHRYSEADRKTLKELVGLDKYFVVGCIGTNKRTKGLPELIYTARCLRELGADEGVKFYCHANPREATMMGYQLDDIAHYNWDGKHPDGVSDMFLWKQIRHSNNYWLGVSRDNGSLESLKELAGKVPDTPEKRGFLFANLDFLSILNTLDLYVDLSQNEGWGLPLGEALASGVPAIAVNDYDVRQEIYDGGVEWVEPLPKHMWSTLHTGARLVTVDPMKVAKKIIQLREDSQHRYALSICGQTVAGKYKWDDSRAKMTAIVEEVAEFVFQEDEAYATG